MKLYTAQTVAKFLNLSDRRVRQLRDEGVFQEVRPGLYHLVGTTHRYIDYLRGDTQEEGRISYHEERAKLVRVKRENEELNLKVRKNELHEGTVIEKILGELFANFRARLMSIPSKVSPILATKKNKTEIYRILSDAVEEALMELSNFDAILEVEIEGKNDSA